MLSLEDLEGFDTVGVINLEFVPVCGPGLLVSLPWTENADTLPRTFFFGNGS